MGGEVPDGLHHLATLEQGQVEVVDAVLVKSLLDGRGGDAVARGQPEPAHHPLGPAELHARLEVHVSRGLRLRLTDARASDQEPGADCKLGKNARRPPGHLASDGGVVR